MDPNCKNITGILYRDATDTTESTLVFETADIVFWDVFAGIVMRYYLCGDEYSIEVFETCERWDGKGAGSQYR
jgi:hypothetical protein